MNKDSTRVRGGAGRKPYDVVLMFKILILQRLCNLSDEQTVSGGMKLMFFGRFETHVLRSVFFQNFIQKSSSSAGWIFFPREPDWGVASERVVGDGVAKEGAGHESRRAAQMLPLQPVLHA